MKKILLLNGHPAKDSYNRALSEAYQQGARQAGADLSELTISDLSFDPNLAKGYRRLPEMEPDLQDAIERIRAADHLVWLFPVWWYSYPALMKGFIDRVFLPGIAFKYEGGSPYPKKLLKGKSARLILTADAPLWYYRWYMLSPTTRQMKTGTLELCGIRPVRVTFFGNMRTASPARRERRLERVEKLGQKMK